MALSGTLDRVALSACYGLGDFVIKFCVILTFSIKNCLLFYKMKVFVLSKSITFHYMVKIIYWTDFKKLILVTDLPFFGISRPTQGNYLGSILFHLFISELTITLDGSLSNFVIWQELISSIFFVTYSAFNCISFIVRIVCKACSCIFLE